MMQPTPAPTTPPKSPEPANEAGETVYPAPPQNVGSAPFHVLAGLFDRLANERKPEKRRKVLDGWFNHWREEKGYDLYPVLRLILPHKDRERAVYGLKEKNLAKTYIKLIPLQNKDPDAIRLLNWKRPTEKDKASGDFPTVLYEVVSKRSSVVEGSLSVEDMNDILDELSQNMGKSEIQSRILQRVYNRSTPEEQRWIVRIILKDMVISVKETTVFSVFHPDAQDLFNTCSDLKKVAWELWDPKRRLNEDDKAVQLFRSFAPMLCKRPTRRIEESVKEMGGGRFIIEEKLDGERMQLHKRGNEYYYCSRKGKDYTYLYGKHVGTGSLTPHISDAFDSRVVDIILDGEMLVWDPVSERNLPFGTLKTAALDKGKKELSPRPCFKVFDLLYLNGISLLNKSTKFRKRNLKACVKEVSGRIELVVEFEGRTAKDVRQRMEDIMATRGEGLIMKHPDAEYVLNGRNRDWIKVKPEYMDNMGETVDVLVVAANYGSGRRSGGVSTLICAVIEDRRGTQEDDELKYSSFVRVGTGFSFSDFVWIRSRPWKERNPAKPPSFLLTAKKGIDDKGDCYLEPEDSFIIRVKAAEITPSDQYHMGYTMRFPRALAIREDLHISDCMTATAVFESLKTERKRKMETEVAGKGKKKRKTTTKKATIMPEYSGQRLKDLEVESDLFDGVKFMVMSDPKSRTGAEDRQELMKLIHINGGQIVQVANRPNVHVIYSGTAIPYDLKLIMNKDMNDVLKPQWINDSLACGEQMPLHKSYFFHSTSKRKDDGVYNEGNEGDEGDEGDGDVTMEDNESTINSVNDDVDRTNNEAAEVDIDSKIDGDPSLADWFKVEKDEDEDLAEGSVTEDDTDPESDNDDVKEEDTEDDWLKLGGDSATDGTQVSDRDMHNEGRSETLKDMQSNVSMGEDSSAMEYDQDMIFRHLCFYLDSPKNARRHGMVVKPKHEIAITSSFDFITKLISDNGGRVVDLDEPKLTHVVLDKRDDSRRRELLTRTSKPKRRHLVISEYIQACLDEDTLLDEDEFAP